MNNPKKLRRGVIPVERVSIITPKGRQEALLVGVFQRSTVIEPSIGIGGHSGGVVAFPVAVVKVGGKLKEVMVSDVEFEQADSKL